eukprot:TRINITY_DN4608_c1_g3_i1.p1 TRINITY_DN4608_c1_g3~~TRINITY_DN4608_c1_g3_i1.p1  ORF type:complete len:717 (+),score=157.21 TRINITY_DN4608_c1_g3_i1:59-2209(+)
MGRRRGRQRADGAEDGQGPRPEDDDHPDCISVCDPATKQKITLQWSETHHTAGRTVLVENLAAGRKRDSYLCMLYQKGLCRSHQRCNQVHADKARIQQVRDRFFSSHGRPQGQDEPLAHQRALEVVVVDPADPGSRLTLPFSKTGDTEGRRDFFHSQQSRGGLLRDFRICPAFVSGMACSRGASCPDIHADRSFIKHITEPRPCCPFHGEGESRVEGFRGRLFMVNKCNQRCPVPIERVASTKGSKELLPSSGQIIFACNRVCRLHQEKRCPWGGACANLHVCREYYAVFSGCSNPSLTCLPSQPGLQIMPSGKLRPLPLQSSGSGSGSADSPSPATGVPLAQSGSGKQGYGIPLVTSEGPVPRRLLPQQALRRYPSAPGPGEQLPPDAANALTGLFSQLSAMQGAPAAAAAMAAMYAQLSAASQGFTPVSPPVEGTPADVCVPMPSDESLWRATRSDTPGVTQLASTNSRTPPGHAASPVVPETLRAVTYADSEPDDSPPLSPSVPGAVVPPMPAPLPLTTSSTSSLAPPPLAVNSELVAVSSSLSPAVSFGPPPLQPATSIPMALPLPGVGGVPHAAPVFSAQTQGGAMPQGGIPQGGMPQGGMPQGGMPQGGIPQGGIPQGGMPQGSMPQGGTMPQGGAMPPPQHPPPPPPQAGPIPPPLPPSMPVAQPRPQAQVPPHHSPDPSALTSADSFRSNTGQHMPYGMPEEGQTTAP